MALFKRPVEFNFVNGSICPRSGSLDCCCRRPCSSPRPPGQAAAGRAMTILSKRTIPIRREVSIVNSRKCSGCESCVLACPYHARIMDEDEKIAIVLEPLCQACGACAMVCPNAAAILPSLKRGQVYSMIDAAVSS